MSQCAPLLLVCRFVEDPHGLSVSEVHCVCGDGIVLCGSLFREVACGVCVACGFFLNGWRVMHCVYSLS